MRRTWNMLWMSWMLTGAACAGELLYNGIRLPDAWPPQDIDPRDAAPMRVPYLESLPEAIPIDVGRQLFVDDFLIDHTDLQRQYHRPVKYAGNPVLKPETELELNRRGNAMACPKSGGVWWDPAEKLFKMWYGAGWNHTMCYATSRDGLAWDRPSLDVRPGTNQILPSGVRPASSAVVLDLGASDPLRRYALFMTSEPVGAKPGSSMTSADGVHWSDPTPTGVTHDRSTMFYNPFRKKWVYSLRSAYRGRSRDYWECDDFLAGAAWKPGEPVHWASADRLDLPDPDSRAAPQLYNLDAVAYESLMLGVYELYLAPPNTSAGLPKITELNFAYSRDGFHWHRPDRTAHIRAERRDVWDRGYVQSVGNVCCLLGDRLCFYYTGFQGNPEKLAKGRGNGALDRGATGVAFLRRDGFVSLDAGQRPGTLVTRPVRFGGSHLFVNLDAPRGELRAEVLAETGQPIAPFTAANCVPVTGDDTSLAVVWKDGDLASLRGRTVRFRFTLRRGSLYAFWVSRDASGRSDGYVAGGGPGFTGPTDTVGRTIR